MTKYRIRLVGGRVIGPFIKEQLLELKDKGHISGKEEAQIFPTGSWGPIVGFDFYKELIDEDGPLVERLSTKEETFVIDLTRLRQESAKKEIEELVTEEPLPLKELTETAMVAPDEGAAKEAERERLELVLDDVGDVLEEAIEEAAEDSGDKTMLNPVAQKELEKMRQRIRKEEKQQQEEEERRKEAEAFALIIREEEKDESTKILNIAAVKSELLEIAKKEEKQIEKVARKMKKIKALEEAARVEEDEDEDDDEEEEEEEAKAKKKKLMVIIGAVLLAYAIFFPESKPEKPPFKFVPPQIEFPVPYDKADTKASTINFDKGKDLFDRGGYVNLVAAGVLLKTSYENSLDNLPAMNLMLRSYAEQLKYSKEKLIDAQTVFSIIQSKRPQLLKDPNGAIGMNLFYMAIGKHEAAADVTAKYIKLNPKNFTPDLFSVYLKSLIKVGDLGLARQIFTALNKAPDKNRYAYDALIEYLMLNQESEKAEEYLDEAIMKNPQDVAFLLRKAEILFKTNKFKEVVGYLKKAEELNLEYNDVNRAKFFEFTGLLLAAQGEVDKATAMLSASLKLVDSFELRMRLAELSATKGSPTNATEKLIAESKAIKLLNQAKEFYEKRSYELAMSTAARATDAYPGHIPSELFLAKVQMRLGLAEQAIVTLEELVKRYPEDKEINFSLIEAYIDTYKFNDAKNRIAIVAGIEEIKTNWEFASLNAKLYMRMGDTLQAMNFLKMSMNMNPLNDKDVFHLAEMFLKRNNFDSTQLLLNKCMELDPINPDYRIAYAKVIYEKEDDQAAIGYLLTLLEEFGENPKFLSEIAIMYYRAGKVKDFMAYKEKLAKMPNKDKALYEFLIKAALLDERYNEIPSLVEQLLAIEPGELEAMMTAGRVLFENGKLKESAFWFKRLQDKLPTYPKVQYYIAKIKMLAGEIEDPVNEEGKPILDDKGKPVLGAISLVKKDIKENGENDTSLVLLADIHVSKGELVEAENLFKKAQKINPRSYDALVGMADISTKRNNHDIALDLYRRAMNIKGEEPILHRKMGDVYRLIGQGTLAMESYKMYLEMNPDAEDKAQIESYINLMK